MTMGLSRERASHRALEEAEMLEHGAFTHELGHAHHVPLVARVRAARARARRARARLVVAAPPTATRRRAAAPAAAMIDFEQLF